MTELVEKNFNASTPFELPSLPPQNFDFKQDVEIWEALTTTTESLTKLGAFCLAMPNAWVLFNSYILFGESVDSLGIEAIHTTVGEALQAQLFPDAVRKKSPDQENKEAAYKAVKYIEALKWGATNFEENGGLVTRIILAIRTRLMEEQTLNYRRVQNHLHSTTGELVYTPPSPERINNLMSNWENFVNGDLAKGMNPIIKSIIAHYQFEAIHPFLDGNGRTGRILLVLQLVKEGKLTYPVLHLSKYLKQHKKKYYEALIGVTQKNDWTRFVLFMLKAIDFQSRRTISILGSIMSKYEELKPIFVNELKLKSDVLDHIFSKPITTQTLLAQATKNHYTTAKRVLEKLVVAGILKKQPEKEKNMQLYINKDLYKILTGFEP